MPGGEVKGTSNNPVFDIVDLAAYTGDQARSLFGYTILFCLACGVSYLVFRFWFS